LILQKFRNYFVKVAVVLSPAVVTSSKFGEMVTGTNRGSDFRVFDNRGKAVQWLVQDV